MKKPNRTLCQGTLSNKPPHAQTIGPFTIFGNSIKATVTRDDAVVTFDNDADTEPDSESDNPRAFERARAWTLLQMRLTVPRTS